MATTKSRQSGFTLIEMMVAVLIIMIIFGAIFQQIRDAQLNSNSEQVKMDLFQQGREFMDQLTRDLRNAGYPNPRNAAYQQFNPVMDPKSSKLAVGLVEVGYDHIWFEGDMEGTGQVSVVRYTLDSGDPLNLRLKRSQVSKVDNTDPSGQTQTNYQVEIEHVQNKGTAESPIFMAYDRNGDPIDLSTPVNLTTMDSTGLLPLIADVNSIKISINLQAATKVANLNGGTKPITALISTVRINNCSQAGVDNSILGC